MPNLPAIRKDDDGLTLPERKLLTEIAMTSSWQQAADNLGITQPQLRRFFKNPAFKHAYDGIFGLEDVDNIKRELEMVAGGAGRVLEDALKAETDKSVNATCPKCDHHFKIWVRLDNWASKLRAVENLLKIVNILKDKKSVEHEGTVGVVHMTAADQLAILALRSGRKLPPHIMDRLRKTGALEGLDLREEDAVEAEFTVVDDGKDPFE